jgi:hypothetical protein
MNMRDLIPWGRNNSTSTVPRLLLTSFGRATTGRCRLRDRCLAEPDRPVRLADLQDL